VSINSISPQEKDLFQIAGAAIRSINFLNEHPQLCLGGWVQAVDLNSATTDTTVYINSPTTNYFLHSVLVKNKGTTASITTATAGLFTATGGGGTTIAANQALSALTSNAVNTAGGLTFLSLSAALMWLNASLLYFRVGTAQGAAATADVYLFILPLPDNPMR
jgi:hypothetical protein